MSNRLSETPLVFLLQLSRINGTSSPQTSPHPGAGVSGRVAAVYPYIQTPSEGRQDPGYPPAADPPPKPVPLGHIRSLSGSPSFCLPVGLRLTSFSALIVFLFLPPVCWLIVSVPFSVLAVPFIVTDST